MPYIVWRSSLFLGLLGQVSPNEVFGIMITASHNPAKDNGLKIMMDGTYIIEQDFELQLEAFVHEDCLQTAISKMTDSALFQKYSKKQTKVYSDLFFHSVLIYSKNQSQTLLSQVILLRI